VDIK
jgi:hypothetical protein